MSAFLFCKKMKNYTIYHNFLAKTEQPIAENTIGFTVKWVENYGMIVSV